eukprot:8577498-Prorocentrum_lima.AAC.1
MRGSGSPITQEEWWQMVRDDREAMAGRDRAEPPAQAEREEHEENTHAPQQPAQESSEEEDSTDAEDLAKPLDPKTKAGAKPRAWPAWHLIAHIPVQHRPHNKYFDIRGHPPAPTRPPPAGWHTKALPPPQLFGAQRGLALSPAEWTPGPPS